MGKTLHGEFLQDSRQCLSLAPKRPFESVRPLLQVLPVAERYSKRVGRRGIEWSPGLSDNMVISIWCWRLRTNVYPLTSDDYIDTNFTPSQFYETKRESPEMTELERAVQELLASGRLTEEYAMDLFTQEAIFQDQKEELLQRFHGKEVVICGGEIFVGETLSEAQEKAVEKHPGRPFFAASLGTHVPTAF